MKPRITAMKEKAQRLVREYRSFILFIALMIVFRSSLADWNTVPTGSMKPTIVEGDRILVNKLAYDVKLPLIGVTLHRLADPLRGDIVVFESEAADKRLVKRVIGVPGDEIMLWDNRLVVNGVPAEYRDVKVVGDVIHAVEWIGALAHPVQFSTRGSGPFGSFGPITVPEGQYFVLGDNRDNSADSRAIGFVPRAEIVGRSRSVVVSLDYAKRYSPRWDRFFHDL